MSILIIADHSHTELNTTTLNVATAALALKEQNIHILIAGFNCQNAAEKAAQITGVTQVIKADAKDYAHLNPENIALLVSELAKDYAFIMAPANTFGRNILPRAAALLDIQPISNVTEIIAPNTFKRPIYAGNAIATLQSDQEKNILTIRTTNFEPAPITENKAEILETQSKGSLSLSNFIEQSLTDNEHPPLSNARIVIGGGKALGSKTNFQMIEDLARTLGGAIGATRAAVDAGYISNDVQIGQTGQVIAPDLYIAIGISGAIQHVSGIKDSKTIIAINTDKEAPIFSVANYGLEADLFEVIPELIKRLSI